MARGINKAILVGHLGKDPEVRYTAGGASVANITVATAESWKDKQSGEKVEKTEWHRVVFFGRLAEIVAEYLKKGAQVYIEGRIQTRKWQDKEGNDRYTTEIVAHEMQMLGSRAGAGGGGMDNFNQDRPAPQQSSSGATSAPAGNAAVEQDFDDDIPF